MAEAAAPPVMNTSMENNADDKNKAAAAGVTVDDVEAQQQEPVGMFVNRGPEKKCSLSFQDLNYTVKLKDGKEKDILKNVTGAVAPGEVLAIMGPSGSGKTSLLDAVAHRLRTKGAKLTGRILFNGRKERSRGRRQLMSYVSQEDSLMGVFTVRETLWFAARFYYGYGIDTKKMSDKVEALIDAVGLRSCADTIVGNLFFKGLSGGQIRRLSVAVELISSPAIVLLDEPTSGLDSASAFAVIGQLRELAAFGHTVVCTIHQPSSEIWAKFDQFMLIAQGKVCYSGEAKAAVDHFAAIGYQCPPLFNPADYVINLVTTDFQVEMIKSPASIDELAEAYEKSALKKVVLTRVGQGARMTPASMETSMALTVDGDVPAGAPVASVINIAEEEAAEEQEYVSIYRRRCVAATGNAGFFANFVTLLQRNLQNMLRNPGIIFVREMMYLMLAIFLGLTFLYIGRTYTAQSVNSRNCILFFVCAFFVFMTVAVLPFIIEERAVFLREKRNGAYTAAPYVLAQCVALLPGTFFIAVTTSIVIVFMVSLNGFGYYLLCLWFSLIFAETFVYLVGSISPHYIIGIAGAAGFFGMCMVVEGFFIVFYDIGWWIRWMGYITPHRYSFRAFMRNEYTTINVTTVMSDNTTYYLNGSAILDFYGYHGGYIQSVGGDLGILLAFALAYSIMFYMVCEFYWK